MRKTLCKQTNWKLTVQSVVTFVTAILLTACANGLPSIHSDQNEDINVGVSKHFIGVPVLLSLEGSSVRLNEDWILSAAHNESIFIAEFVEYYEHPTCDVILAKVPGEDVEYDVGLVQLHEEVRFVGYPIGMPLSSNPGYYEGDVYVNKYSKCQASASTSTIMSGMSGGGVFNEKNELVGVAHGFARDDIEMPNATYSSMSIFTSINAIKEWVEEITHEKLDI